MKKQLDQIRMKSREDLIKEIDKTVAELASLAVENSVNPLKDTNALHKKRKYLARIKSVLQETTQK